MSKIVALNKKGASDPWLKRLGYEEGAMLREARFSDQSYSDGSESKYIPLFLDEFVVIGED